MTCMHYAVCINERIVLPEQEGGVFHDGCDCCAVIRSAVFFKKKAFFGEEIYDECFEGINLAVLALDHGVEA